MKMPINVSLYGGLIVGVFACKGIVKPESTNELQSLDNPHFYLEVRMIEHTFSAPKSKAEEQWEYYYEVYLNESSRPKWRYPEKEFFRQHAHNTWSPETKHLIPSTEIIDDIVKIRVVFYDADWGFDDILAEAIDTFDIKATSFSDGDSYNDPKIYTDPNTGMKIWLRVYKE